MPVKRRIPKRRDEDQALIAAWDCVFAVEYDFFGDLRSYGLETDAAVAAAAPAAWARLGNLFLESWLDNPWHDRHHRPTPYALDTFGQPPEAPS